MFNSKKSNAMKKSFILFFLGILFVSMVSFTAGMEYQRGDVTQDGSVDIEDVTCLINYILNGTWPEDPVQPTDPDTVTFTVNGVSFTMVAVEGGTFMMGATPEQDTEATDYVSDYEKPVHEVTLSSYQIGKTEVTQALWVAVMDTLPCWFTPAHGYDYIPERPVEYVSWNDCQAFIAKLNALTGYTFRLPTEAEWEYAARGGNKSRGYKYAGGNVLDEVAWWNGNAGDNTGSDRGTHAVGTKAPNELGLYDMSGNVLEWCQDYYGKTYYNNSPSENPTGPETGFQRVYRGGCWGGVAYVNRVAYRNGTGPDVTQYHRGLRLAM